MSFLFQILSNRSLIQIEQFHCSRLRAGSERDLNTLHIQNIDGRSCFHMYKLKIESHLSYEVIGSQLHLISILLEFDATLAWGLGRELKGKTSASYLKYNWELLTILTFLNGCKDYILVFYQCCYR